MLKASLIPILPFIGVGLCLSAFSTQQSGTAEIHRRAHTAIEIYSQDNDDVLPLAIFNDHYQHPKAPYPYETATGWWESPERRFGAATIWANAVAPYANAENYLEIPDLPGIIGPGVTPEIGKPVRRAGLAFNGLLHAYAISAINRPAVVPLLWPGFGQVNLISQAGSNPVLHCKQSPDIPDGECKYRGKALNAEPAGFVAADATYVEKGTDFAQLLMADGSSKRVRVGFRESVQDPKKIHTLLAKSQTFWFDQDGYPWHFSPDRTNDDFGTP